MHVPRSIHRIQEINPSRREKELTKTRVLIAIPDAMHVPRSIHRIREINPSHREKEPNRLQFQLKYQGARFGQKETSTSHEAALVHVGGGVPALLRGLAAAWLLQPSSVHDQVSVMYPFTVTPRAARELESFGYTKKKP